MGETDVHHYLNPLTVEASIFLNYLKQCDSSHKQIDEVLQSTLESVLVAIETFLRQQPKPIVATKNTQIIPIQDIVAIRRIYHCEKCRQDLGKSVEKAALHLVEMHRMTMRNETRSERRVKEKAKRANAMAVLPKKAAALLNNNLSEFFTNSLQLAEKLKQLQEYNVLEEDLRKSVKTVISDDVKLFKFGSRISGIGTLGSDLDIFVDIGNCSNTFETRASAYTLQSLHTVRNALRVSPDWGQIVEIDKAIVPILKSLHKRTGIQCDIGFSNSLGYYNTKLMEYLFGLQPLARRLCIFLKRWLERTKLNDRILSTYSISLMVVFFLQQMLALPSIEQLQNALEELVHVGPWIANFMPLTHTSLKTTQLPYTNDYFKSILQRFFDYYSNFEYERFMICPYIGQPIEISQVEQKMPKQYQNFLASNENADAVLKKNKPMVVQDPVQLNHNVTKAITQTHLKVIRDYFRQSANVIDTEK